MRKLPRLMVSALLTIFAVVACGNDADETATKAEQPDRSVRAFCEANAKLDAQQEPPTAEQFRQMADVAPPEIKQEIDLVAERVAAEGEQNAFDDPAVSEAAGELERWQKEHCPGTGAN